MILFHRSFRKDYDKRDARIRARCNERIQLFEEDPFHPTLENHALTGEWLGYRSINVTGDFRAVFKQVGEDSIFTNLDTHPNR